MKKKIQDPQFIDIYIFYIAFIGMDKYPTNHKVNLIIYKNGEIEFEILKFIGEGSFGHVYLSRNLQTDKLVCLKVFNRYKTYTMEHIGFNYVKNLLPDNKSTPEFFYSGFDKVSEKYIIIMEYIEGPLLKDVLPTIKEPKIILSLLKQMLEIVGTLGKVGLIHRDIKESNVIVQNDAEGNLSLRLIDLGLLVKMGDKWDGNYSGTPIRLSLAKTRKSVPEKKMERKYFSHESDDVFATLFMFIYCLQKVYLRKISMKSSDKDHCCWFLRAMSEEDVRLQIKHLEERKSEIPESMKTGKPLNRWVHICRFISYEYPECAEKGLLMNCFKKMFQPMTAATALALLGKKPSYMDILLM